MKYEVTSPDGKRFEVTAPDGATEDQILEYAKQQFEGMAQRRAQSDAELRKMADPTGTFGQNVLAGAGKFFNDMRLGVGERLGFVSPDQIKEQRQLDAPLMRTGGGITGNLAAGVTTLAPTVLLPGASSVAGAATIGGLTGTLQPYVSTLESLLNPVIGAAGAGLGQKVANWAGGTKAQQVMEATKAAKQNAQIVDAAKSAREAGYVIPPADLPNAGKLTEALSGLSGKIKTAQVASERNQPITNDLARKAVGVAQDSALTTQVLDGIRKQAGQAYEAVASSGTITPGQKYTDAIDNILKPFKTAQAGFPNAKANPIVSDLEALKSPSFDASAAVEQIRALREAADKAYATRDKSAGKAFKAAADALEAAIEDHLKATNAPADLVKNFREARQLIAKTYTVQKALNETTGNVSAQVLAGELKKGRPLSGELLTAAKVGQAFPKATQALKETPKSLSPLDFATAGIGYAGSGGSNLAALGLVARPGARSLLLSQPVQNAAVKRAGELAKPSRALSLLSQESITVPAGILGADALLPYVLQQ